MKTNTRVQKENRPKKGGNKAQKSKILLPIIEGNSYYQSDFEETGWCNIFSHIVVSRKIKDCHDFNILSKGGEYVFLDNGKVTRMNRAEAMEKIISLLAPSELMDSIKDAVDQYNAKDMPEPRKSKKLTPEDFIRKGWKLWHEFTEVNDSRSFLLSIFMKGNQFALLREETGTATKIALSGDGFYDDELDPIISGINRCINADKIPLPAKPKPLVKPKLQSPVVKFYKQGWEEILDDGEGNVILLEKEGKYLLVQRNGKSKSISKHEAIQFFSQFMHPSLAKDITDAVDAYSSKKPEYKIAA